MRKIYLYTQDRGKALQISAIAMSQKIGFEQLSPKNLGQTVGSIAGTPKSAVKNTADSGVKGPIPLFYNMPEVLLMDGLAGPDLDAFLSAVNFTLSQPIKIKSVITPYNAAWTLYELIEHVKKEADMLG